MTTAAPVATLLRLGPARAVARRRLFCLPYAGGGVAAYAQWWRNLPDDIEVVGVQLPGRESRLSEPPLDDIGAMARAALHAVRASDDLPYAIFGHSMGALVAFELTLRIEADDTIRPPQHLVLSGRRAPGTVEPVPDMLGLDDHAFLDALQHRFGAVTDEVRSEPELLTLLLPVLRADVRAVERYRPAPGRVVHCAVDVCGGRDDLHPRPDELGAWQRWAEQPLGLRVFDGDHFYLATSRLRLLAHLAAVWGRPAP
jgi:medium-chain acyl-[acyl-carrier-protein] hydrolase